MSVIDDDQPTTPRRERAPRKPRTTTRRTGHRKITPPNKVEPGWIHTLLAGVTLRALKSADIEAGDIEDDLIRQIPGQEDGPEPAELLSRVYAHLSWRIPGVRSIAKRLEGKEAKAGLGSDLLALALALWLRNRDLVSAFREQQRRSLSDELHGTKAPAVNIFSRAGKRVAESYNSGAEATGDNKGGVSK